MGYDYAADYAARTAYGPSIGSPKNASEDAPRTISSAIGRIDGLNDRLAKVREHLAGISDQIGGPRPTDASKNAERVSSAGVVGKLNDATEAAHVTIGDIEALLGSIGRALG